jgi:hypothetical protein
MLQNCQLSSEILQYLQYFVVTRDGTQQATHVSLLTPHISLVDNQWERVSWGEQSLLLTHSLSQKTRCEV